MLALCAPAAVLTGIRLHHRERDVLTTAALAEATVRFTGTVSTDPRALEPGPGGVRRYLVTVRVRQVERHGHRSPSRARLAVIGPAGWADLSAGQEVTAWGRLERQEPGRAEAAIAYPRAGPQQVAAGSWPWRVAESLRQGLRDACAGLPTDARGLLPALVVGDTSHLDPGLKEAMQAAGLTHLTAVSGGNVTILGAAVFLGVAAIGGGRRTRVLATALVIVGFVVVARPEPSVLRAGVTGALGLVGLLLARRGAGVPMLAATTVLLLGIDPWLARSFGFALSVLATAGILVLVPLWQHRLRNWPRGPVLALSVPLAAQLSTAPVTVLLDPVVSLVAVPANLLAGAAVAPATVAGVTAAALSPVWPGGAQLTARVGGSAAGWIAVVARCAAAVPAGTVPWPSGPVGSALLTGLSVLLLVLLARRAWRTASLLPAVVVVVLVLPRWIPVLPGQRAPSGWVVVQCDVGQGSATVIRSGPDRAVMVDTGPDPRLADRCLSRLGVRHLDLVLITHFHADHCAGLQGALAGRGRPPVRVSPVALPAAQAAQVAELAPGRVLPVTALTSGTTGTADWSVRWNLIPPSASAVRTALGSSVEPEGEAVNNVSVVFFAQVHGLRIAALGDLEPQAQRSLLRTLSAGGTGAQADADAAVGPPAAVDVVVLAHHGSSRQEERLYRLLHPRVALVGVGADNDYGHPAPAALAMLDRIGAVPFRTDLQGRIAVLGSPDDLRVVTER